MDHHIAIMTNSRKQADAADRIRPGFRAPAATAPLRAGSGRRSRGCSTCGGKGNDRDSVLLGTPGRRAAGS